MDKSPSASGLPSKPDILLILADQLRPDHVGFAPDSRVATPHIDRIAAGTAFLNCVTANPVCTPARTALLTGKYSHQIGMLAMSGDLSPQHPTFTRALQGAGYHTAAVGKLHWHQGWPWGTPPRTGHDLMGMEAWTKRAYGLDDLWEVSGKQLAVHNRCRWVERLRRKGLWDAYEAHCERNHDNTGEATLGAFDGKAFPLPEVEHVDRVTADEAIAALGRAPKDKPLFLMASFSGPHPPLDPPGSYLEKEALHDEEFLPSGDGDAFPFYHKSAALTPELKNHLARLRRAYRALIRHIDDQVGRLWEALEARGKLANTLVLFSADHGESLGDRGRFQKSTFYRQTAVVPTALWHSSLPKGNVCRNPVELTDLTATMLSAAGLDPVEALSKKWPAFNDRVPCRSLLPIAFGRGASARKWAFGEYANRWRMLRGERFLYVRILKEASGGAQGVELLFDHQNDPGESRNLAKEDAHRETLLEARQYMENLMEETPAAQLGEAPWGPWPEQGG